MARIEPTPGSATERRKLRGDVRRSLGVSSEMAPNGERICRAAGYLDRLLDLTTHGHYRVRILRHADGAWLGPLDAAKELGGG